MTLRTTARPRLKLIGACDMYNELIEELILLCEVRGELDDEANARTERKIAELEKQIRELENDYAI